VEGLLKVREVVLYVIAVHIRARVCWHMIVSVPEEREERG
jgi:hypothetical protein